MHGSVNAADWVIPPAPQPSLTLVCPSFQQHLKAQLPQLFQNIRYNIIMEMRVPDFASVVEVLPYLRDIRTMVSPTVSRKRKHDGEPKEQVDQGQESVNVRTSEFVSPLPADTDISKLQNLDGKRFKKFADADQTRAHHVIKLAVATSFDSVGVIVPLLHVILLYLVSLSLSVPGASAVVLRKCGRASSGAIAAKEADETFEQVYSNGKFGRNLLVWALFKVEHGCCLNNSSDTTAIARAVEVADDAVKVCRQAFSNGNLAAQGHPILARALVMQGCALVKGNRVANAQVSFEEGIALYRGLLVKCSGLYEVQLAAALCHHAATYQDRDPAKQCQPLKEAQKLYEGQRLRWSTIPRRSTLDDDVGTFKDEMASIIVELRRAAIDSKDKASRLAFKENDFEGAVKFAKASESLNLMGVKSAKDVRPTQVHHLAEALCISGYSNLMLKRAKAAVSDLLCAVNIYRHAPLLVRDAQWYESRDVKARVWLRVAHWALGDQKNAEKILSNAIQVIRDRPAAYIRSKKTKENRMVRDAGSSDQEGTILRPEAPRRVSPEKREAIDTAIDQLLAWDVVEPSSSPASFPVLMVRQYGKMRFCVDYRQLNASTIPDRYPLPTVDSVFQTLCGKRIFSSLDAIRGYHQLPVRPSDRWKTAFTCHRGLFQYKTVPFGLRNAPAVFQRLMDRLLGALRWQDAVVYIDDIVVATTTMDEHVHALDSILSSAEREGLRFSPGNCTFAVGSLVLLGRKVSGAGVAIWRDRAVAVRDLARPSTLKELYHALGLFGYYRMFVRSFAQIAEPLPRLTRGWRYEQSDGRYRLVNIEGKAVSADRCALDWGEDQRLSFDRLKAAIASPPTLAHPDPSRPYLLYIDASKAGFGAILHQSFETEAPPLQSAESAQLLALDLVRLPPPIARERWTTWLRADRHFAILREAERVVDFEAAAGDWVLNDDVLVRGSDGRIALPEGAVPELLRSVHDNNGHFGFYKTYLAVARSFWLPGLSVAVRSWVKYCRSCQKTKVGRKTGVLDIAKDPQLPFETISLDLVYGFPSSRSGNNRRSCHP
ncbi:hypothetical protein A4X06_0g4529 [Tilletia controversa]|uniref:Reverse transcriptase domain-containing protein n=1 Tax=Tilletia controversa TaxID=13291 RepID=A0A8X7MSG7_9BASI|nr:hypothetical protein A4X06_0g4529 [Tilletia controversa]